MAHCRAGGGGGRATSANCAVLGAHALPQDAAGRCGGAATRGWRAALGVGGRSPARGSAARVARSDRRGASLGLWRLGNRGPDVLLRRRQRAAQAIAATRIPYARRQRRRGAATAVAAASVGRARLLAAPGGRARQL